MNKEKNDPISRIGQEIGKELFDSGNSKKIDRDFYQCQHTGNSFTKKSFDTYKCYCENRDMQKTFNYQLDTFQAWFVSVNDKTDRPTLNDYCIGNPEFAYFKTEEEAIRWMYSKLPSRIIGAPVVHELKTWRDEFMAIVNGLKPFEFRKNDRDFRVGDYLLLRDWNKDFEKYSDLEAKVLITYKLENAEHFGLPSGYCILGIKLISINFEQYGESHFVLRNYPRAPRV